MPSREDHVATYVSRVAQKHDVKLLLRAKAIPAEESVAAAPAKDFVEKHTAASEGVEEILKGHTPTPAQTAGLEAIILPEIRPVLDILDGDFHTEHPLWQMLNNDETIRGKLHKAIPAIGRIELPGNPDYPYGGTGFVVGKDLIMTNRHVAEIFASGIGTGRIAFKPGLHAGIDFLRELNRAGDTLNVKRVVMIHPYWDMALLAVDGLPPDAQPLQLSLREFPAAPMVEVAAIGYPAFDYRNDPTEQNDLFRDIFGVKRLLPGTLGGRQDTESFGKMVSALRHNCSTLGGNSGSALIDFKSGEVVALHFGGRSHVINYGVPASELARDARVVDAGVTFAGAAPGGQPPWKQWWDAADESTVRVNGNGHGDSGTAAASDRRVSDAPGLKANAMPNGDVQVVVPLFFTVSLASGTNQVKVGGVESPGADTEAMVPVWHDKSYEGRPGYEAKFLDTSFSIPMPQPADPSVVALAKDGSSVLKYQNFSIVMHAKRRLALITASNVTAESKLKKPEPSRDYSRKGLSGLGDHDQEQWFPDPRLDPAYQLSDYFYTRDDGAFDKGHIVRREDVAWGNTYALLRRANGDTYHVTNCSPQVANFNRSNLGEDNWGDLENHVLKSAATERYCQFAGPVLGAEDQVFVGKIAKGGVVRIKIPARFWKVIVAKTAIAVASYGFLLEQDLADVPLEFVVPENFRRLMVPLTDIQDLAGIKFPKIVLNADQYATDEGVELAFRAGLKRRSKRQASAASA